MSHAPFTVPAKPDQITQETLPQLFAHHQARFGGWSMSITPPEPEPPAAPERPEGVSEEEWNALSDPGRAALTREREARQAAERALAAARARPTPPKPKQEPPVDPPTPTPKKDEQQPDLAALIQQAVDAAVKPFVEREQQRDAQEAAEQIQAAVVAAAKDRLHDATDALTGIDLTAVVDEHGKADPEKIKAQLDALITRKPHLAKSTERVAPPGIGGGGPANTTDAERVKSVLAEMQRATGVRIPTNN